MYASFQPSFLVNPQLYAPLTKYLSCGILIMKALPEAIPEVFRGSLLLKHRLSYPSHQQKYLFFISKGVVQRALRYLWWNQLTLSTLMSFHPPDVLLPRPRAPILQSTDSYPLHVGYPLPRDNTR